MTGEALWPALDTLGEDLILLSPRDRNGSINTPIDLGCGLMGAELVRLVAGGYVDMAKGRIVWLDVPPPTDANLAAALESIGNPKAKRWVAKPRKKIVHDYEGELESKDVLRSEHRRWLGLIPTTSWFVVDEQQSTEVRRRLDEIITASDAVGLEDFALAGLVYAVELGAKLYPGSAGKERRKRLKQIATAGDPGPIWRRRRTTGAPMTTGVATSDDSARVAAIEAAVNATIAGASLARLRRNSSSADASVSF